MQGLADREGILRLHLEHLGNEIHNLYGDFIFLSFLMRILASLAGGDVSIERAATSKTHACFYEKGSLMRYRPLSQSNVHWYAMAAACDRLVTNESRNPVR